MTTTKTLAWALFGLVIAVLIVAAICREVEVPAQVENDQATRRNVAFEIAEKRGLQVQRLVDLVVISDRPDSVDAIARARSSVSHMVEVLQLKPMKREGFILIVADPWALVELRIALGARGSLETRGHAQASYNPQADLVTIAELPEPEDPHALARLLAHELLHRTLRLAGRERIRGSGAWIEEGLAGLAESLVPDQGRESKGRAMARALAEAGACEPIAWFMDATEDELDALLPVHLSYHFQDQLKSSLVQPSLLQSVALAEYLFRNEPKTLVSALRAEPNDDDEEESSGVDEQAFLAWLKLEIDE